MTTEGSSDSFDIGKCSWYTSPLWPENGPAFMTLSVLDP